MAEDNPSLFIDEDWKARAQREKEELQRRVAAESVHPAAPSSPLEGVDAGLSADLPVESGEEPGEEAYEASFGALLSSLATQAMFSLGLIAPQGSDRVMVNLEQARFTIDMLFMLQEKTKGNLTAEEEAALTEALTELQRLFMARMHQIEEQAMRQAGIDPNNLKGDFA